MVEINQDERRARAYIIAQLKVEELVEFETLWKQFISEAHRYGKPYKIAQEFEEWKQKKGLLGSNTLQLGK